MEVLSLYTLQIINLHLKPFNDSYIQLCKNIYNLNLFFRGKFRMIIRHFILSLICILYIISCEGRPGEASLYTEFDKITLMNKTNIKVTFF